MKKFSLLLLSSTLIIANDNSEYFINRNGKRIVEQQQKLPNKKLAFLKPILQEKLVEFSVHSRQLDKVSELKNLIEEPDFFNVAEKLLRDPDYDIDMQNLLVSIAQDPTIPSNLKKAARAKLTDDYTPFLSLKSHKQAGLEAQEAIDASNYFKIWEQMKFPILYYKEHESEILKTCLFVINKTNAHLFYRIKSAKLLNSTQNQDKETLAEILLSILKDISPSQLKTQLDEKCFIETANLLKKIDDKKEKTVMSLSSLPLIKNMVKFGNFWENLSVYEEYFSCLPFLLTSIIAALPSDSIESEIWTTRLKNLFQFCINHSEDAQKRKISEKYILLLALVLDEGHYTTKTILDIALENIDTNRSNGFLSIYKILLEKRKDSLIHTSPSLALTDNDRTKKKISINFDNLMIYNNDLELTSDYFDRKNLYPCIKNLLEEYKNLSKIQKDALNGELKNSSIEDLINFGTPFLFSSLDAPKHYSHHKKLFYLLEQVASYQETPYLQNNGLTAGSYLLLKTFLHIKSVSSHKYLGISILYSTLFNGLFSEKTPTDSSENTLKLSIYNSLQKAKETALCLMAKKLTDPKNADHLFNNIQYFKEILGAHIGLRPTSEQASVQSLIENNSNWEISSNILKLSTQEILDLFYQDFFSPKKLILHIQESINNKAIKIFSAKKDVTLDVSWAISQTNMNDTSKHYIVSRNGSLEGIKIAGALKLLQHFGFLTSTI